MYCPMPSKLIQKIRAQAGIEPTTLGVLAHYSTPCMHAQMGLSNRIYLSGSQQGRRVGSSFPELMDHVQVWLLRCSYV